MSNKILVTDSLFIFDEHVKKLEEAGFEVERLDKPEATEAELCEAVKGKVGYILGGIEHVTEKVIDAADQLKVISLIGVAYSFFIPCWEYALQKGVAITNTPQGPTQEVAEWAITATLIMNRRFLELGLVGKEQFAVTKGIEAQKVGIVGLGRIGTRIAEMLKVFKPQSISYYGRHRQYGKEKTLGVEYLDLPDLLKQSDIIYLCVPDEAKGLIDAEEISMVKKDALLVNITHPIIRPEPLLAALKHGDLRAISDHKMTQEFDTLPLSHWYCMNNSNTITQAGSKLMSDMAVTSLLNILQTGDDQYSVKPGGINP